MSGVKSVTLSDLLKAGLIYDSLQDKDWIQKNLEEARSLYASAMALSQQADKDKHIPARFQLLYETSHKLLTCALKAKGYEMTDAKGHRQKLFGIQPSLLPVSPSATEILMTSHTLRNADAYGGVPRSGRTILGVVPELEKIVKELIDESKHSIGA